MKIKTKNEKKKCECDYKIYILYVFYELKVTKKKFPKTHQTYYLLDIRTNVKLIFM